VLEVLYIQKSRLTGHSRPSSAGFLLKKSSNMLI